MIFPIVVFENVQEKEHERIETEKAQDKIDRIKLLCLELGIKWSEVENAKKPETDILIKIPYRKYRITKYFRRRVEVEE